MEGVASCSEYLNESENARQYFELYPKEPGWLLERVSEASCVDHLRHAARAGVVPPIAGGSGTQLAAARGGLAPAASPPLWRKSAYHNLNGTQRFFLRRCPHT